MAPPPEVLPVTLRHDIYPGIDPKKFAGSAKGKVIFITGASRGIGEVTAKAFAQCGADIFLASRRNETLEQVKADILKDFPEAKIGTHVTDVTKHEKVKEAVDACVKQFGKIDVVISNSGTMESWGKVGTSISERDPDVWWQTWEVNVKGSFNVAHYTIPELAKTKGYFIFISSAGAQGRRFGASAYQTGKHAINRIAEFAAMEHAEQGVKVFSLHPGGIKTDLAKAGGAELAELLVDELPLPAWTMVRLVSGNEDYLSGRYISASWDLDEVDSKFKEAIIRDDALKNRLALPSGV